MPFVLELLRSLKQAGWKVKIHDSERLEPPHITIYQKMKKWRLSLRHGNFLDTGARWTQIDSEVKTQIESNWKILIAKWDLIHPDNPVEGDDDE